VTKEGKDFRRFLQMTSSKFGRISKKDISGVNIITSGTDEETKQAIALFPGKPFLFSAGACTIKPFSVVIYGFS
jgi:hypothetical protein